METTQSAIDSLRELNSKITSQIVELRKEKDSLIDKNAELLAKEAGLNARINHELERSAKENEERFAKLERNQNHTVENGDNSSEKDVNVPDPTYDVMMLLHPIYLITLQILMNPIIASASDNASNSDPAHADATSLIHIEPKSLEEKEEDEFVDSMYKEQVSKEIIQSIREKKLRDQELLSTHENNTTPNIFRDQSLIQEKCQKISVTT
ncbi:hypothetical protein Glove_284g30 [Diversispora epigaea]|uniref:Uncharacterized protein n=1 Tax=Diversispora epigaea TaxID=1348612 RepID=A0A397I1F7_9GLOM|nr:hypothetical protein Glove_284g30 [Diversispora epigaea]